MSISSALPFINNCSPSTIDIPTLPVLPNPSEPVKCSFDASNPPVDPCPSPCDALPKSWSSLFSTKHWNASVYTPKNFDLITVNGINIKPTEVVTAGRSFWSE